jgi:general secretion pathway protein G
MTPDCHAGLPLRDEHKGYTVVELLMVLAVMGVLALMVVPLAELTVLREREAELKRALWEIRDAIDAYKRAQVEGHFAQPPTRTGYPPDLQTLTRGLPDKKSPGQLVFFLRRVPRDPFADPKLPPEKTWGLRSYDSGPDQPQSGSDVYDVYSRSTRVGLNGQPLRDW